jgi:hypothetical protein
VQEITQAQTNLQIIVNKYTDSVCSVAVTPGLANQVYVTSFDGSITHWDYITDQNILPESITNASLQDSTVTNAKLADNSVSNTKMMADAVQTVNIQDAAITNSKLAANSVTSDKIAPGTIIP